MRRSALFCLLLFVILAMVLALAAGPARADRSSRAALATTRATNAGTPGSKENPLQNPCTGKPFTTVMTGAGLESVSAGVASFGSEYVINFTLANNDEGKRFPVHTKTHIGQPMAIVLDGEVLSVPVIQSELTTGGQITGNFTKDAAQALALQLQSGTLPVSFDVESIDQNDSGVHVVFVTAGGQRLDPDQLDRAGEIIANRLQALGIADPVVNLEDDTHISVDLPADPDPQTVIDVIRRPALLEFVDFSRGKGCTKPMPVNGQFIVTDVQLGIRGETMATQVPTKPAARGATKAPTRTPTKKP